MGLEVSLRTMQRIAAGEVLAADEVTAGVTQARTKSRAVRRHDPGAPILSVGEDDLAEIRVVLQRAARSSYLELAGLDVERRPGEVIVRASIYEPEEEYE